MVRKTDQCRGKENSVSRRRHLVLGIAALGNPAGWNEERFPLYTDSIAMVVSMFASVMLVAFLELA